MKLSTELAVGLDDSFVVCLLLIREKPYVFDYFSKSHAANLLYSSNNIDVHTQKIVNYAIWTTFIIKLLTNSSMSDPGEEPSDAWEDGPYDAIGK